MMMNDLTGVINRQNRTAPRHVHYDRSQFPDDLLSSMPSHNLGSNSISTLRKPRRAKKSHAVESFETVPILPHSISDLDDHAGVIACEMEKDSVLMEDSPHSEQLRIDTLREMPESLTLKRVVKKKLLKTVSQRSKRRPIGCFKRMRYRLSIMLKKMNLAAKDVLYSLELWYSSLKVIEGHFGSGVATYFRFFRWIFLLNITIVLLNLLFLAVPQELFVAYGSISDDVNSIGKQSEAGNRSTLQLFNKIQIFENDNASFDFLGLVRQQSNREYFSFEDIFVGEGSFTDSILYYGFYTNTSFSIFNNLEYSMPLAYFFTTACCFGLAFIALSISVARSYRKVFIETSGGVKNVYAHKIFCGWDYSIATSEAADLKSKSIYNEIKEILAEDYKESKQHNCKTWFQVFSLRVVVNCLAVAFFVGTGAAIWVLLGNDPLGWNYLLPVVITAIMVVAPWILSLLLRIEDYESPRIALYVNLVRIFIIEMVAIMTIVIYWFNQENVQCWETFLGQELYRLVILDFFILTLGSFIMEFLQKKLCRRLCIKMGPPEFDIARNTLNLIYNETLLFMGFFFSPLLPLVVAIKMFITFYIKKIGTLYNCQPASKSWRASQTQTMFLILTFLSLLASIIAIGYLISYVNPSQECGPFHKRISILVVDKVFDLEEAYLVWKVIFFLTKPGVVGLILVGMIFLTIYIRAKAVAHAEMIEILKDMLATEAVDKEFLLTNIAKVTEAQYSRLSNESEIPKPSPRKSRKQQMDDVVHQGPSSTVNYSGAIRGMRPKQSSQFKHKGSNFQQSH